MTIPWKSSIDSRGFEKLSFLVKTSKRSNRSKRMKNKKGAPALRVISRGNQVDVSPRVAISPMESNTETVAKRVRVGPHTQMLVTME